MKYHIQIPETMSDDACSSLIELYSKKIAEADLVILDFKLVVQIESSGLLRIHTICTKINPTCNFKIVNTTKKIKHLLGFTPLGQYL